MQVCPVSFLKNFQIWLFYQKSPACSHNPLLKDKTNFRLCFFNHGKLLKKKKKSYVEVAVQFYFYPIKSTETLSLFDGVHKYYTPWIAKIFFIYNLQFHK